MDNYTFFTTPEGAVYGVSERVMKAGYIPKDGVLLSTNEEINWFKQRSADSKRIDDLTDRGRLALAKKLFQEKIIPVGTIRALTGVNVPDSFFSELPEELADESLEIEFKEVSPESDVIEVPDLVVEEIPEPVVAVRKLVIEVPEPVVEEAPFDSDILDNALQVFNRFFPSREN